MFLWGFVIAASLAAAPGMSVVAEEAETEEETETEYVDPSIRTKEDFVADIAKYHNARVARMKKYSNEELNEMTDAEYIDAHLFFAEAEEPFYDRYVEAEFDDFNIKYLSSAYCEGINGLITSCKNYQADGDYGRWITAWKDAYVKCGAVLLEVADYYEVELDDKETLTEEMDTYHPVDDVVKKNSEVKKDTVKEVQQLLNDIGFNCGKVDGLCGKQTVRTIERFQEMFEYLPADGLIDEELVDQLETEKEKLGE